MVAESNPNEAKRNIPVTDVEKLHAESLQLRSQQFFIGTLALTGSGLALGFSTGLSTSSNLSSWVMLIILVSWLFVLGFLFYWSLSLKSLVMVISEYLKSSRVGKDPATHWESWYYYLSATKGKNLVSARATSIYPSSQTALIQTAFLGYGAIASVVNIASYTIVGSSQKNDMSSGLFLVIVLALFSLYWWSISHIKEYFSDKNDKLEQRIADTH